MTEALFLGDVSGAAIGAIVRVGGDEGHHAVAVRRIRVGEVVLVADGLGHAVRGPVISADKAGLGVEVGELFTTPESSHRWVAAQALAKGDRAELAVEAMSELGIDEVVPWNASRSEIKWAADRADKAVARWQSKAREAAKQSRRFRVPSVTAPASTDALVKRVAQTALTLVLHESGDEALWTVPLPEAGEIMFVIGPEGGITEPEQVAFRDAGARVVTIADAVLRTSTAGVVALAQLQVLAARQGHSERTPSQRG
ncbi:MAG: 16S rRNA (uracil(1498)-N(3))-methyltransferase [Propionibacteriaceae bacterium]|nr:16S rRNA (uracil(1498)-N(3))-methyltransferase [Micropruina sp.]HBX79732.1 16S rRNA (uracil(1498)-N(3))-methyltransferase [Propionibacteriaceae bacterium]HBY24621.1 16S rRNA (uracil(1498)-N(3))-methyltransferase [Propionibacteriaceae bacterium]